MVIPKLQIKLEKDYESGSQEYQNIDIVLKSVINHNKEYGFIT